MTIVIYSLHARKRLRERELEDSAVRTCLVNPGRVIKTDGERINVTKLNGEVLVVICRKTDDIYFVITAYKSSKIAKYFR